MRIVTTEGDDRPVIRRPGMRFLMQLNSPAQHMEINEKGSLIVITETGVVSVPKQELDRRR